MRTQEEFDELLSIIEEQSRIIEELKATVAKQALEIEDLKRQLNQNSQNSSKPPSTDGFKPAPKSQRKPSGKSIGGQKGHKGSRLEVPDLEPTEIIQHFPEKCTKCPNFHTCKETASVREKRHVLDCKVIIEITEHQSMKMNSCEIEKCSLQGDFPDSVRGTVQYGVNLQALAVALNTVGAVSVQRTHEILSGVFNIPISTGTISNMVQRCADLVTLEWEKIKEKVINSNIVHFDETGIKVDKKLHWVHVSSTSDFTFLDVQEKRGVMGMNECGVLPNFNGIAIHDCWAPYWKYPETQHGLCCAHFLRELNAVLEQKPEQTWANQFKNLLLEMKRLKEKAINNRKRSLSYYFMNKINKKYDEIIRLAKRENPILEPMEKKRGKVKKGKTRSLVERLEKHKASVCLFVKNFAVPFDNNLAERDLRMTKAKTKISGCFRTLDGARDYLKIMSYISTTHKHNSNAFFGILNIYLGSPPSF